ncbi:Putative motility protein [Amphibacillus marinus]|uniref:Putative motility protein n=1 Tax=Amphibacillus marinus TaxID=872970 RepID=A0A1H8R0H2_9BACI|nr:YjfB family protein [Amphibacillus marinus]SEO59737.1 Putative motility protein [Amphibacillus marinus]
MDIAKLSMAMSQTYLKQQVSLSLMKQTMEQATQQADQMIDLLEQPVHPYLGADIDVSV